jgi:hypothetical protein
MGYARREKAAFAVHIVIPVGKVKKAYERKEDHYEGQDRSGP